MVYEIIKQLPEPKSFGRGKISLDRDGCALAMDETGEHILDRLYRAKVDWIAKDGFLISGFETAGFDKTLRTNYKMQEWFVRYI